ncbi:MAG TPA: DUF1559 domain-containing protein [Pirellulales bacterium]|nr:DUF1559 domain-containing protein [Pirellulales bacterium]
MACPRCGADSTSLLPAVGGRTVCRRCGASVVTAGAEPAASATVVEQRRRAPVATIVLLIVVVLFSCLYLGGRIAIRALEARMRRDECERQLHKISVALQNYADENGVYPPAVTRDATGRPLHSWRVLILPHLEKADAELHKEYHYDEPWDGPHNRELASRMPGTYRCPEDPGAGDSYTSYVAIVDGATGEFAAYPAGGSNAPPKKTPMTKYLVVESAESGINWMEPKDITLGSNGQPTNPLPDHFGYHVGGSLALKEDDEKVVLPDDQVAKAIVAKPGG